MAAAKDPQLATIRIPRKRTPCFNDFSRSRIASANQCSQFRRRPGRRKKVQIHFGPRTFGDAVEYANEVAQIGWCANWIPIQRLGLGFANNDRIVDVGGSVLNDLLDLRRDAGTRRVGNGQSEGIAGYTACRPGNLTEVLVKNQAAWERAGFNAETIGLRAAKDGD